MTAQNWRRNRFVRHLRIRPRLYICLVVAVAVELFLPLSTASHPITRLLLATFVTALLATGFFFVRTWICTSVC